MRRDPDRLISSTRKRDEHRTSGRLRVYLGMCAGVGKTFSMLEAAQRLKASGVDVVIGIVETHGRADTQALLDGIETLPRREISYRNTVLPELDVDAILRRRPSLVLVDELAHTNAPGSRHEKRWQDVEEILQAGIDVYTTLNVQHVESKASAVRQVTGLQISETVPDRILDLADDVELVDLTPDDLRRRLKEGRIYLQERVATAEDSFFRVENLIALREIALRTAADRIDDDLRNVRTLHGSESPWPVRERLLVGIGPSPSTRDLIRWTRSSAAARNATWIAVHVRTAREYDRSALESVAEAERLARDLGAEEVVVVDAVDVMSGLLDAAERTNATQIVIGKAGATALSQFRSLLGLQRIIRMSGSVDIAVVGDTKSRQPIIRYRKPSGKLSQYLVPLGGLGAVTAIGAVIEPLVGYLSVGLFMLMYVAILPLVIRGMAVFFTATVSAILWNLLFIPPRYTLTITKPEDALAFIMYFTVATVFTIVTSRIQRRELIVSRSEQRNRLLLEVSSGLSRAVSMKEIMSVLSDKFRELGYDIAVQLVHANDRLAMRTVEGSTYQLTEQEFTISQWVKTNRRTAGKGTKTFAASAATFYPLFASENVIGVFITMPRDEADDATRSMDVLPLVSLAGPAIDRERLRIFAETMRIAEASEDAYRTLIGAVGHELRTPIAGINGVLHVLRSKMLEPDVRSSIDDMEDAMRSLEWIVQNVLDTARIHSGELTIRKDWIDIRDCITNVIRRLPEHIASRLIVSSTSRHPLIHGDAFLLESAVRNLIANATTYSPSESVVTVTTIVRDDSLVVDVMNQAEMMSDEQLERFFDKFTFPTDQKHGIGLGLSIVKAFVEAHEGNVFVRYSDGHIHTGFSLPFKPDALWTE